MRFAVGEEVGEEMIFFYFFDQQKKRKEFLTAPFTSLIDQGSDGWTWTTEKVGGWGLLSFFRQKVSAASSEKISVR
jgi:hypothetical protein